MLAVTLNMFLNDLFDLNRWFINFKGSILILGCNNWKIVLDMACSFNKIKREMLKSGHGGDRTLGRCVISTTL